jgi:tetratricopeptide (TPR) repeat protein
MRALLALCLWLLLPDPAAAQAAAAARGAAARQAELDRLFEALRGAPDEAAGAGVESRIRALWAQAASPAASLLLRRGLRNLEGNAPDEAVEDFDAALTLQPDFAEAWVMRADSLARLGDTAAAARDLQEALRLEPRHFGALLALSQLQEDRGDLAGALRSLEAALAIHPKLAGGVQRLRELRRRVHGDDA